MKKEVLDQIKTLMAASFGLIAALAWNDAIGSLFKEEGPLYFMRNYGPWGYALLVTILAVLATIWLTKIAQSTEKAIDKTTSLTTKLKNNATEKLKNLKKSKTPQEQPKN